MKDCYEIVVTKFKRDVDFPKQKIAMEKLNEIVFGLEGFKARNFYYSDALNSWIDFVIWKDESSAKSAAKLVGEHSHAKEIFDLFDQENMLFSQYEIVGSFQKAS